MKVLVTGGAGFIGSHVVDRLLAAGHEPRILDVRRSPYHRDGEVEAVIGDLLDPAQVRAAAEGCDAITHLAAAADVNEVAVDPSGSEELNSRGTLNVLEAARDLGIRVVYASTIWVYSDTPGDVVDEETALLPPSHLYTATKLAGELYCRSYRELYDVESTVLRFGIPYGPRARPAAVIPAFVRKALAGEPLTIAGTGEQTRRFVYVEDLAEGVVRGLSPLAADRTYNLVGAEDISIREIATTVRDLVGDVDVVHTEGRAGDFKGAEVSGERAARELDWRPETSFREGVRRYIAWHREEEAAAVPQRAAATAPAAGWLGSLRAGFANTLVAIVGLLAGLIAAVLGRADFVADPATFIGTLVILGVPMVLLGRVDWTRNWRMAALVLLPMALGAVLTAVVAPSMNVEIHVSHGRLLLVGVAAATAALTVIGRRLARSSVQEPLDRH